MINVYIFTFREESGLYNVNVNLGGVIGEEDSFISMNVHCCRCSNLREHNLATEARLF